MINSSTKKHFYKLQDKEQNIERKEPLYQLEENRSGNRPTIRELLLSQDQAEHLANLKRVCSDYRHTIRKPLLSQDQARER